MTGCDEFPADAREERRPTRPHVCLSMTSTADVLDEHRDALVCELALRQFGGVASFEGVISTVRCHEDNVLLKQRLVGAGRGPGARRRRRRLAARSRSLGDMVAGSRRGERLGRAWSLNGCVRDVAVLR